MSMAHESDLTLRHLNLSDMEDIIEASNEQPLLMKSSKPANYHKHMQESVLPKYLSEGSSHIILGAYADNKLIAYGCAFVWTDFPYWTLCNLHSSAPQNKTKLIHGAMGAVVQGLIKETQDRQLYRMMFLTAIRGRVSYRPETYKTLMIRAAPQLDNYQFYTEAIIPKNTRPSFEYQWVMMGERMRPFDTAVRVAELAEPHRTPYVKTFNEYFGRSPNDL